MTSNLDTTSVFPAPSPRIQVVPPERPWLWLAAGWKDFLKAPRVSLLYGTAIAGFSATLVALLRNLDGVSLLLPSLAGFALLSPFLAVGLYAISRALSDGKPIDLQTILATCRPNLDQIGLMGALLMMIHLAWIRAATLLFAIFFAQIPVALPALVGMLLGTPSGFAFLAVGTAIGAVLATLTFAISVTSLPMLVDLKVNVVSAIATSWAAATSNVVPMALWAAIIAGATLFGFVTYFLGFVIVMPLLGYASWHAYRDLVTTEEDLQPTLPHLMPTELP